MTYFPSGIDALFTSIIAIGSFGLKPGPSLRRIEMCSSFNGVSHDLSTKRSVWTSAGFPSALEMHRLIEVGLWGGTTESAWIQPREGTSRSMATFDGTS